MGWLIPTLFFAYAGISLLFTIFSLTYFQRKSIQTAAFKLSPVLCFLLTVENSLVAISDLLDDGEVVEALLGIRIALYGFICAGFLVVPFELAYITHKRRSVNFCGIKFDVRHRDRSDKCSYNLRYSMWLISIALLVFVLVVDLNVILDPSGEATRRYSSEANFSLDGELMDILPTSVVFLVSLYIGLMFWRYGTLYSFKVHATICNPWIFQFVGATAFFVGKIVAKEGWDVPFTSNGGEIILAFAIMRTLPVVDQDLQQGDQFEENLKRAGSVHIPVQNTLPVSATPAKEDFLTVQKQGKPVFAIRGLDLSSSVTRDTRMHSDTLARAPQRFSPPPIPEEKDEDEEIDVDDVTIAVDG